MSFDLMITAGKIIDGTGNPWYRADIGIQDGQIAKIGQLDVRAEREIDAIGMIVCPGFVDPHNHSDVTFLLNNKVESMVHQGVTTMVVGQCGVSLAPMIPEREEFFRQIIPLYAPKEHIETMGWRSFAEYLNTVEQSGLSANAAFLVGHATVRVGVMEFDRRAPTPRELETMKELVDEAMRAGAFGLSSALALAPGAYARPNELSELLKVVGRYGGAYFAHIRDEANTVVESLKEAIKIGESAGIPVQIAHFKALGKQNWGRTTETLKLLEEANTQGFEVYADQYPFRAASVYLSIVLPPWAHEGGTDKLLERLRTPEELARIRRDIESESDEWQNVIHGCGYNGILVTCVRTEQNKELEGKSLAEIAEIRGAPDPFSVTVDLLLEESADIVMVFFGMAEDDVKRVMKHPYTMVGTDGWAVAPQGPLSGGKPHPRTYSTYPRILRKYVREEGVLSLEEAIRKMTSFPAQRLRLQDRGVLREGMWADIVVLDPETIRDNATFTTAHKFPSGIPFVLVNGVPIIDEGHHTGATPGKILRWQIRK